jgi:hypothetical protein
MPSCPDLRSVVMLRRSASTAVAARLYEGTSLVDLTSGTLSVYDETGALHSSPAVTITAEVATASVTLSTVTPARGWRLDWVLTPASGSAYAFSQAAVVSRLGAVCPVTSDDVKSTHPELFGVYPSGQTSWQTQVDAAWAEVQATLVQANSVTVDTITDSTVLYPLVLRMALVKACRIGRGGGGKLADLAATYEAEYADLLRMLTVSVDTTGDGLADDQARADAATWTVDGAA